MPLPQTTKDVNAVQGLQGELARRGVPVPKTMQPLGHEEATLLRFLIARKHHVEDAADMFQASVAWRDENNVDTFLSRSLPDDHESIIRRCQPAGWIGYDRQGCPVWMEHIGGLDVAGMEAAGLAIDEHCLNAARRMEYLVQVKLKEASDRMGQFVDTHTSLLDLEGCNMSLLNPSNTKIFGAVSRILQDHYPELMGKTLVVNTPVFFKFAWSVVHVALDERVRKKLIFLGKKDLHRLKEYIAPEYIPKHLGGSQTERLLSGKDGYVPPSLLEMDEEIRRRAISDMALAARAIDPTKFHRRSMVEVHHRPSLLTRISQVFSGTASDTLSGPPSSLTSPRTSLDGPPRPVGPVTVAPRASGTGLLSRASLLGLLARGSVKGLTVAAPGPTAKDSASGQQPGPAAPIASVAPARQPSPVPESPFAGDDAQGGGALADTLPNGLEARSVEAHRVSVSGAGKGADGSGAEKGEVGNVSVVCNAPGVTHIADEQFSRTEPSPQQRSWAARALGCLTCGYTTRKTDNARGVAEGFAPGPILDNLRAGPHVDGHCPS